MTKLIIRPKITSHKLVWNPEPYFGNTSLELHTDIENPDAKILLLVRISRTQFERHATFEAGAGYKFLRDSTLWWVGNDIILAIDQRDIEMGDNNIYAISEWKGHHVLFGRMLKNNIIAKICRKAFKELLYKNAPR